jgi:histidine triad (HIT) family protein
MADAPTQRDPSCLFCRIVAHEVPADVVGDGARTVAFRDIAPQAPSHVLVVTHEHYPNVAALVAADPQLAAELMADATAVAAELGLDRAGYRLVLNTGTEGGQTVSHVHVHVLGGRIMRWPPG